MTMIDQMADVQLEDFQYPVPPSIVNDLVDLLRTEWTRTDYDWLEAMYGDYHRDLAITSVLARHGGRAVSTASVLFSQRHPEIALLANVLTRREFRGRGIGGRVVEAAATLAANAGCQICLLGTKAIEANVYRRHGFAWHSGVVMRRQLSGTASPEDEFFRPGQCGIIRPADWGDLPGVTLLAVQRLETILLDYCRGLLSGRSEQSERCVSLFPLLLADVRTYGGIMAVLAGRTSGRVFGFGTATVGAGAARRHTATIDLTVHDHYYDQATEFLSWFLNWCQQHQIVSVQAHIAELDTKKLVLFRQSGFAYLARLRAAIHVNGEASDVIVLQAAIPQNETRAVAAIDHVEKDDRDCSRVPGNEDGHRLLLR